MKERITRTVIVGILEILKYHTTGPHASHVGAKYGLDFGKHTGLHLVASIFGEEDGNVPRCKLFGACLVARTREGGSATPFVVVEAVEVDSARGLSAVEVFGNLVPDIGIVVGGVAHGDRAVILLRNVRLHVTGGGLDKGVGRGGVRIVCNLIAHHEAQNVVITLELIDDSSIVIVQRGVPGGVGAIDRIGSVGQVEEDIDARIRQGGHAGTVVQLGVDRVDANQVRADSKQMGDVAGTARWDCQGIGIGKVGGGV